MKAKHFFLIFAATLLSSCEKVVYIDLNTSTPHMVVESNIINGNGPFTVKLSRSVNYYDGNSFPAVTGATVVLSDNGNSEVLKETDAGTYRSGSTNGIPGHIYRLSITTADGKVYTSSSTMPAPVPIDSITVELRGKSDNNNAQNTLSSRYRVTCSFKDPANEVNFYRLILTSNDTAFKQNRINIISDKLTDGQEIYLTANGRFIPGDSLHVTLQSIDMATYDFYNTLTAVEGDRPNFLSAPPANPTNNISNGALGYFSAYSVTRKSYIIH